MISDVDYFHRSAVSVAYLFLYKQKDFLKIFSFSGRLRRRQRRWHRPWRRDVINSHGHFHLRKATSCYDLARHIKTPSETLLEGIGKPHPRPIYGSLPPAGGSQRGRCYAQQDCVVEPALRGPSHLRGCLVRGTGACLSCHHSGSGGGCCKLEPPWARASNGCAIFFQYLSLLNYSPTDKD